MDRRMWCGHIHPLRTSWSDGVPPRWRMVPEIQRMLAGMGPSTKAIMGLRSGVIDPKEVLGVVSNIKVEHEAASSDS